MKTQDRILTRTRRHSPISSWPESRGAAVWLVALAVALVAQTHCLAQKVLFSEDFESVSEWSGPWGSGQSYASWRLENGQAIMRFNRMEPTDPSGVPGWHATWEPNGAYRFGTNTLEFSMDLVGANQDDAFALLSVNELGALSGYLFGVDHNEACLAKYGDKGGSWFTSYFYGGLHEVTQTHLRLSVAYTRYPTELVICLRILDRDDANRVLWQREVHDTTAQDAVLSNQSWKGLQMDAEGYAPPVSGTLEVGIGIAYLNTQEAPTEPVEVTVDNYTVLEYPPAAISEVHSLLLSWPEDTFEEQIIVGADSLEGPWTPVPEPCFHRNGELCTAVPAVERQQYFKLVPGIHFIDEFASSSGPLTNRAPYNLLWSSSADDIRVTNDVLRIFTQGPVSGGVGIMPPGGDLRLNDFHASVDILDWKTSGSNWSVIGIVARGVNHGTWIEGYIGMLSLNTLGAVGRVGLIIYDGTKDVRGPTFDLEPGTPYRLQFSGVGSHLLLRVLNLNTHQVIQEMPLTDTRFTQGVFGIWVNTPDDVPESHEIILDNLLITGTKP